LVGKFSVGLTLEDIQDLLRPLPVSLGAKTENGAASDTGGATALGVAAAQEGRAVQVASFVEHHAALRIEPIGRAGLVESPYDRFFPCAVRFGQLEDNAGIDNGAESSVAAALAT